MSTTEQLIEEVKLHNILFDLSHPDYKNIKKKDEVWEQMARSLRTSGKFTHFSFIFINYLLFNLLCIVVYKIISTEQLHTLIVLSKYLNTVIVFFIFML